MNLATTLVLFSVLMPDKGWFTPDEPININVKPPGEVTLVLTDFTGKPFDPRSPVQVSGEKSVNLRDVFETFGNPGTYVLYAVPKGRDYKQFVGTPLVIQVRVDRRAGAPATPMVIRVLPLCFAEMQTDRGNIRMGFYYDVAPNTVDTFMKLASDGFYDGLRFHRIEPGFVIQTGDPRGDGTGGPGFTIDAEFSDREHGPGVVSMARESDPIEDQGAAPRAEYANTAGSQFFICLSRERTKMLDRRYTVFGKVVEGMDTVNSIAATPIADAETGTPREKRVINSLRIIAVTAENNPYDKMLSTAEEKKD